MHHINNTNKRLQTIKLFLAYAVIAVVLVVMTYVLVLAAAGYDIDRSTGSVIQNGVLLLETDPEEASVYLNGELESDKTPSRFALPQGEYNVRLEFEDYRAWESNVDVSGSQVTWLYYPQLIPNTIETSNITTEKGLKFFEVNDKADQIAAYADSKKGIIQIYNINDAEIESDDIKIPVSLLELNEEDELVGSFEFVDWSSDGSRMLLKYTHSKKTEHIYVDLGTPSRSKNIDTSLGLMIDDVFFGPRNNNVYVVRASELREYDPARGTVGEQLFAGLEQYDVEDKDVWVVGVNDEQSVRGVYRLGRLDEQVIALTAGEDKTLLASNYESKPSIALYGNGVVELFTDIRDQSGLNVPEKIIRYSSRNATIEFSPHGRFLSVIQGAKTVVYDLETQREHVVTTDADMLGWLDAQRLYYSNDGQLNIIDFNGDNNYQIASFDDSWGVYLDERQDAIFTIGTQSVSNDIILRRSLITLE